MLSLVELERVADVLSESLVGGRIERWLEPSPGRITFSIYRRADSRAEDEKRKCVIDIDARPEVGHVALLGRMPKAPKQLPAFSAFLRAHLARARLESVSLRGNDRQLALHFEAREGRFVLLLSLFGRRSNLYLLDAEGKLVLALRPLSETRPELEPGAPYVDPSGDAPRSGQDRFAAASGLVLLEEIAAHYAAAIEEALAGSDRRRLVAALKKERKSASRRVERIEAELAEAEEANELQRNGELLKANLSRIVPGEASLVVSDFETGEPVEIPIDPKLSAKKNLNATFKRYQKLLRRLTKAGGQIESARDTLETLEALEVEVREAESLDEILERDFVRRLMARQTAHQSRQPGSSSSRVMSGAIKGTEAIPEKPSLPAVYRSMPRKLHPRRYRSEDGLEIWVGRSDEGNDFLTTRFARGKDLFFHLDGAPGSHVILRTEGRDDPPSESVLDACELAVHFSKQKNAGRADVHVVPIKNVKKPRGAKPGLVYVTGGKSIHLRRDPARLERLQKARIED
jgi:predicted ribosome quality control (RQC) complex YloA/Tae2 family protein